LGFNQLSHLNGNGPSEFYHSGSLEEWSTISELHSVVVPPFWRYLEGEMGEVWREEFGVGGGKGRIFVRRVGVFGGGWDRDRGCEEE